MRYCFRLALVLYVPFGPLSSAPACAHGALDGFLILAGAPVSCCFVAVRCGIVGVATFRHRDHQSIRLNDEIVLVRKALVVIVLSLVIAVLVREYSGPL